MSRLPDGSYHLPSGTYPEVPNTTIESADWNAAFADLEQDANTARPIVAGGTGATTAAAARVNLQAERSMQVVTNYDTQVWEPGSFYSAGSATNPPVAGHAFAGIAYGPDANTMVIEARDLDDTAVPGLLYVREKSGGVWGTWKVDGEDRWVNATGDTMTGPLTLQYANPQLSFNKGTAPGSVNQVYIMTNGLMRWLLRLGDQDPESAPSNGSSFQLFAYDHAGVIGFGAAPVLSASRANGLISVLGNPTAALGIATKQYVDAGDTAGAAAIALKVAKAGDTMTGDLTIAKTSPILDLSFTGSGDFCGIRGRNNGVNRWGLLLGNGTAESGGAGSDFQINRYNDAGTFLSTPLSIARSTGNVAIGIAPGGARFQINAPLGLALLLSQDGSNGDFIRFVANGSPSNNNWSIRIRDLIEGDFAIRDVTANLNRFYITPVGHVGIGTNTPGIFASLIAGWSNILTVSCPTTRGAIEISTGQADAVGVITGQLGFFTDANTAASPVSKMLAGFQALTAGTTANNRGGDLIFLTKTDGGSIQERMRLFGSGSLGVGTLATPTAFGLLGIRFTNANWGIGIDNSPGVTTTQFAVFLASAVGIGAIANVGNTNTAFNTTSDTRRKEDEQPFVGAQSIIDALKVWDFKWKGHDTRGVGLFAQDVVDVFPHAVSPPNETLDVWMIDYSKYVPVLISDAQETHARLAAIEQQLGIASPRGHA